VGGTGLEPVTPSLSTLGRRSRAFAGVRLNGVVEPNLEFDRTVERTGANANPCHSCHASNSSTDDAVRHVIAAVASATDVDLLPVHPATEAPWSAHARRDVESSHSPRTDVVGIFPNDRSLMRLAASVVIEQNDEWLVGPPLPQQPLAGSRPRSREREERSKDQRGDARAHRGLSSRRTCRRVTPRPGT
jgi:hypothetical protein